MLQVIGAGFGRTGTLSLKAALEQLGFGPCHHMVEVLENPDQIPGWRVATDGGPVDWDALLEGYRSSVDWPSCAFWRQLARHYPAAKVILTVRDPESWYRSVHSTIFQAMSRNDRNLAPGHRSMSSTLILKKTFSGCFEDKPHAIDVFNRHNQEVKDALPADRLLVYEVSQGWAPLCAFLGSEVPDEPFPRSNTTDEFRARFHLDGAVGDERVVGD